jgi:hypothetical protein
MVFKLGLEAQKHWRRLQVVELIAKVVTGVRFVDGEAQSPSGASGPSGRGNHAQTPTNKLGSLGRAGGF